MSSVRTDMLSLLNGAGSERQKVTEGEGERLKEAGSINRSLASLGLVIKKLVEGSGPGGAVNQAAHIPYRDSRLTFLLQVLACCSLPCCTSHPAVHAEPHWLQIRHPA